MPKKPWTLAGAVVATCVIGYSSSSRADTVIDGGEVGGQVWTASMGPYHLGGAKGHLTVAAGAELRIEAGTVLQFSDTFPGTAASVAALDIAGTLTIVGSRSASAHALKASCG